MPELPEVETVRRQIENYHQHSAITIQDVQVLQSSLRKPVPAELKSLLKGQRLLGVSRRAKYLLFELESTVMLSHLGMTGSWRFSESTRPLKKHDHLVIWLNDGGTLIYHDPRRFGWIELAKNITDFGNLAQLGPEPLLTDFTAQGLWRKAKSSRLPIKALIMDQRVVVGVGNIYASEALYRANILPQTPSNRLSLARLDRLVQSIQAVLQEALASGGSTINDYVHTDGSSGYFQHRFDVYDKEGEPCQKCATKIKRIVLAGRSSFYCPQCQKR